jgi:hypothetical protein
MPSCAVRKVQEMRCSQLTKLSMEPTPYDELAHSSKLININNNKLNINNINKLNININNNNDFSFFDSTDTKGQFSTLKDLDVKTNTPVDDLTGESSLKSGATPLIAKLVTLLLWIVTGGNFIKTFATKTLKTKYAQAVSGVLYATFSALLLLHSAATDVHRRFCSTISATVRLRLVLPFHCPSSFGLRFSRCSPTHADSLRPRLAPTHTGMM